MRSSGSGGRTLWYLPDRHGSRGGTGRARQLPFLDPDDLDHHRHDCQICNGVPHPTTTDGPVTTPPEPTNWFIAPPKSPTHPSARPGRAPIAVGVVVLVALGAGLIVGFGVFDPGTPTASVRATPAPAVANVPVVTTTSAPPPTAPPAPPETTTTSSSTTTTTARTTTTMKPTTTTPSRATVLTPTHVVPHVSASNQGTSTYRGGYTTTTAPSYHPYYAPSTTTTRARGR